MLDEAGVPLSVAFWLFDTEIFEWRLVFATEDVDTRGRLHVYRTIRRVLDRMGDRAQAVPFSSVTLRSPRDPLVQGLISTTPIAPGGKPLRFSRNYADGKFVNDALIYRAA
jgi:hypothetical protein